MTRHCPSPLQLPYHTGATPGLPAMEVFTLGRPALFQESDFSIMEPGSLKAN